MTYPLLDEPLAVLRVMAEAPTHEAGTALLGWIERTSPKRVNAFLEFLAIRDESTHHLIDIVSERFEMEVGKPEYSLPFHVVYPTFRAPSSQRLVLSPLGEAICCDAGLLFARELINLDPALRWAISAADDQTVLTFNRPTIIGFTDGDECEPMLVACNIGSRIINHSQRASAGAELSTTFRYWLQHTRKE